MFYKTVACVSAMSANYQIELDQSNVDSLRVYASLPWKPAICLLFLSVAEFDDASSGSLFLSVKN